MKITRYHRRKLKAYLDGFYKKMPGEKFTILHYVRYLKKRLKNNKDAWIGVSGDTGVGKSYFVLMVGILFGRPFHLNKNVTYIPKGEEIVNKFNKLKFNCMLIDEAAKQMRKVQWQSRQQQFVNVAAMTERYKNNAVFLNLPNFSEFTKSMREGSIIFRTILPYRTDNHARVILQRKSRNWRSDDPWQDKIANLKYDKLEKRGVDISNEKIVEIERSLNSTIFDFAIPNLEIILPDVTDAYKNLKAESRIGDNETEEGKKIDVHKIKYQKLLAVVTKALYYGTLNVPGKSGNKAKISNHLGISVQTFDKYFKENPNTFEKKANPRVRGK